MQGYLAILRPPNLVMSFVGCLLGSAVVLGSVSTLLESLPLALQAAAIAVLFTAAGNTLNDYYDRETDRVNHPERPIPSGQVTARGALAVAGLLFAATVPWSLLLRWELLAVVLVNLAFMASYEAVFKRTGLRGNLLIAWLVASLFLFGGLALYPDLPALLPVLVLALLAFLATLGREIVKDIEDVGGDTDRETLPLRMGTTGAARVAAAFFILAVGLSGLPPALQMLGLAYLPVVLVADAILIYAALNSSRRPGLSQRAAKYGMVVALLAFLVGALP
ncbi:MAG: UbiA family prenyltransferase [Candidatus Thermoplasmatota archaeon]|nr:UbiA family prenyltransferase [Candidatus Thermoplasmatota archaeon]